MFKVNMKKKFFYDFLPYLYIFVYVYCVETPI